MKEKEMNYHNQLEVQNTRKLRELIANLPPFSKQYFRGMEPTTSVKTRISYAYDLQVFFHFLIQSGKFPEYKETGPSAFKETDLELLEAVDIEEYLEYLKLYRSPDNVEYTNDERARHRKLSALRSFYNYFNKRKIIKNNPVILVDMPKLHEKEIIRLDEDEVAMLLNLVEHGGGDLTGNKKTYYEKNKTRNLAIFTLLLGTGIRVSECVGLDLDDVDFEHDRIKVIRKGGKEDFVYFGAEVHEALFQYIENTRKHSIPAAGHEKALFLSIQKKRMGVRSIENLVGSYSKQITTLKHITPHKLRSTYGTALYRQTGDIYLVAEVLGHNDVNTTRKHYAAMDEDRKKEASKKVTLRKKEDLS